MWCLPPLWLMPPSQPTREQMSHRAPEDRVTPKTLCARGEREGSRIDTMAATPSQIYSLTLEEAHRVLVEIGGLSPSLERLVQETVTAEINKRNGLPAATNGMPTIQPAAPVAAAEVPPIANGTVPGKDKETWADLTPEEQMAAQQLGYDEAAWDAGDCPPTCSNEWQHLSSYEQRAAIALGYTREAWNLEALGEEGVGEVSVSDPTPVVAPPTRTQPPPQSAAAAPQPAAAAAPPPNPIAPPTNSATVAAPQPQPAPSVRADGIPGYQVEVWGEMTIDQQKCAMLLGYDEAMWENGEWPISVNHPWMELTAVEQQAARGLGYTRETWDSELEPEVAAPAPSEPQPTQPTQPTPPPPAAPPQRQPAAPLPTGSSSSDSSWAAAGGRRGNTRPPPSSQSQVMPSPRAPPSSRAMSLSNFDSGMMFGCKRDTYDENMSRHLFGLPENKWNKVNKVTDRTLVSAPEQRRACA